MPGAHDGKVSTDSATAQLVLTPHGRLLLTDAAGADSDGGVSSRLPANPQAGPAETERLHKAFETSSACGLLALGGLSTNSALSPSCSWWRDFAHVYFTRLCHTPGLDGGSPPVEGKIPLGWGALPPPGENELAGRVSHAPPMRGLEYLNATTLTSLWTEMDALARQEMTAFKGGAAAWLHAQNPAWSLLGRVTFHLAENKRDETHPFAFLATYTHRLSAQAKAQHLPLGNALKEYAGARDKPALLKLLTPVQKAAERSTLIRELVDANDIFCPLAWNARQAYRFLQEVPVLEESGLTVRIPDWWNAQKPPRPRVQVRIGDAATTSMNAGAMLDFSVGITLDGEKLSAEEWRQLLVSTENLVPLKGKWVEVDQQKLKEALAHWKKVEKLSAEGISFFEGMRLLSGAGIALGDQEAAESTQHTAWSDFVAGGWLEKTLAGLRDPSQADYPWDREEGLSADLRPYQRTGASWLWFMNGLGLGACLADDMGLGKTLQVLALLVRLKNASKIPHPSPSQGCPTSGRGIFPSNEKDEVEQGPSLLVVPASLMANWRAEAARFASRLNIRFAHPAESTPEEMKKLAESSPKKLPDADLVVTTYSMAPRLPWLKNLTWRLIILDEAQAIKNAGARQSRAVKELRARGRIVLTGTPVENRLSDLWSIFDFLNPGLMGSAAEFARYVKRLQQSDPTDYGPLRTLVRPYILRRLKTDKTIIHDLPEKTELRAFCGLSRRQAALYQKAVDEMAKKIEAADGIQRRGLILAYLMRFKQICNHPSQWLGDGTFSPGDSGKYGRLREICEEIGARQEKALVFTQFREMTEPLAGFLREVFGQSGLILHGGTPVKERRHLVETFQREDGPPFFILSLKAGGTGLNLTQASHVIHFDRWWNPAVENQATDRAYRIGQQKNVLAHKFVCRGTVEEKIDKLIEEKKSMAEQLLSDEGVALLTEMKDDELLKFVSLDIGAALGDDSRKRMKDEI
ncbi:MAG: DEAD/DEAH box helicase [Verrucomicrobia bacterium]|nr:DEAD/DEAH box helicase [Verrucomicrobiota bacterium]